jgi:hypothetical protein
MGSARSPRCWRTCRRSRNTGRRAGGGTRCWRACCWSAGRRGAGRRGRAPAPPGGVAAGRRGGGAPPARWRRRAGAGPSRRCGCARRVPGRRWGAARRAAFRHRLGVTLGQVGGPDKTTARGRPHHPGRRRRRPAGGQGAPAAAATRSGGGACAGTPHGGRRERRRRAAPAALVGDRDGPGRRPGLGLARRVRQEVAAAVTPCPPRRATPAQPLAPWRGHWPVEEQPHDIRAVACAEDRPTAHAGRAPPVMAASRNAAVGRSRARGTTKGTETRRLFRAPPRGALRALAAFPDLA